MISHYYINDLIGFWSLFDVVAIFVIVILGMPFEDNWTDKQWIFVIFLCGPMIWMIALAAIPLKIIFKNTDKLFNYIWNKFK